jgi:hypothetical protein
MNLITTDKIREMAQVDAPFCLSIFLPTNRAGQEVNEMVDQRNLKNRIKEVKQKLESHALKEREIKKLLDPVIELMNNTGFWKHQSDGLAIFRNFNSFEYYTLPVPFKPFTYIAGHFYLMPLIPYVNDQVRFYLLAISLGQVKFYEGFPHQIEEIVMDDLLPGKLEEVVGFDFEEKHLQFRSGNDERGRATFHGHGSTSDEEKKMEIMKFFRAVNDGLMKFLNEKKAPLLLAAVDYLVPIFNEVNEYKYLQKEFIAGNPEHEDPVMLHQKARNILESQYIDEKSEKAKAFEFGLSNGKASAGEKEIIQAAIEKRIDTLFVNNREELWGTYDHENRRVVFRDRESMPDSCLLNLAAMHTILNGGKVFLSDPEEMPDPGSKLNGIYRF